MLIVKGLKAERSSKEIVVDKVQMCITEEGEPKIGGIEMGGDLNRLEPMKIENFKDRMATWYLLKEGVFFPYIQSMVGTTRTTRSSFLMGGMIERSPLMESPSKSLRK